MSAARGLEFGVLINQPQKKFDKRASVDPRDLPAVGQMLSPVSRLWFRSVPGRVLVFAAWTELTAAARAVSASSRHVRPASRSVPWWNEDGVRAAEWV
eukprot:scaffold65021_cov59-Phaeocystis_antarctica.AAC.2